MAHKLYRPAVYTGIAWLLLFCAGWMSRYSAVLAAAGVVGVVACVLALFGIWTDGRLTAARRMTWSLLPLAVAVVSLMSYFGTLRLLDGQPPAPMTDQQQRPGVATPAR